MLVRVQRPGASAVASRKNWLSVGRHVSPKELESLCDYLAHADGQLDGLLALWLRCGILTGLTTPLRMAGRADPRGPFGGEERQAHPWPDLRRNPLAGCVRAEPIRAGRHSVPVQSPIRRRLCQSLCSMQETAGLGRQNALARTGKAPHPVFRPPPVLGRRKTVGDVEDGNRRLHGPSKPGNRLISLRTQDGGAVAGEGVAFCRKHCAGRGRAGLRGKYRIHRSWACFKFTTIPYAGLITIAETSIMVLLLWVA